MLRVTIQQLGNTSVLRCEGRIVIGSTHSSLRNAVLSQREARKVFLDMARVERIDAGGLGVLLGLREWALAHAVCFKLMNVTKNVDQILELTNLQGAFEFCSVPDLLCLMYRTESSLSSPAEQIDRRQVNSSLDRVPEARPNVARAWRNPTYAAS